MLLLSTGHSRNINEILKIKSAAGGSVVAYKEERPETYLSKATDPDLQEDKTIYYMIQVLTTTRSRTLDDIAFGDFGHVAEFKTNNLYKYAVGRSASFEKIYGMIPSVQESFPGAFVIAVQAGEIIPLSEARKQNN